MAKCTVTKTELKVSKIPKSLEQYREMKESLPATVRIQVLSSLLLQYMQARQENQIETKARAIQNVVEYERNSN